MSVGVLEGEVRRGPLNHRPWIMKPASRTYLHILGRPNTFLTRRDASDRTSISFVSVGFSI